MSTRQKIKFCVFTILFIPLLYSTQVVYAGLNDDLAKAVLVCDTNRAKQLVSQGANVNAKDEKGRTMLIFFAAMGLSDSNIELLIDLGADVNTRDSEGITALMATSGGDFWAGGNPEEDYIGGVEILIRNGADVNAVDNHGYTALMFAEDVGFKKIARMLKRAGARK